ncbi:MAG: nitroreductase family protein [Alphaproteobacteria bacterium]
MQDILPSIRERHSAREAFDPARPVNAADLAKIFEAARWAPTAHNMQNFEIIAIDDPEQLQRVGAIPTHVSDVFIRENFDQLSFSEEELRKKKVGILAKMFPSAWLEPGKEHEAAEVLRGSLKDTIQSAPLVLIVLYDARKRAPASEGDVLGFMSLGCIMENMWLAAQSLGLSFHVMSVFSSDAVESELRRVLSIPPYMRVAFACRLGYLATRAQAILRVRRDADDFVHKNQFSKTV